MEEINNILYVAQQAALLPGSKILEALSSQRDEIRTKSASTDLVTETDQQCEQLIIQHIKSNFPDHKNIGEESAGSDRYELTDEPTWTVDPIDG